MWADSFSEFINQNEFIRIFFVTFILYALVGFKVIPDIQTVVRTALIIFGAIFLIWGIGNFDYVLNIIGL